MQQNSQCKLCGERDKMINHIISKCSKLAWKEYKTRHDWVRKVIHWELCKKFKCDNTNKWYMPNPEYVLENKMHKVLRDFEIQIDHLILARWPDLVIVNKKNIPNRDVAILADYRAKLKVSEKSDKYLDVARELKKNSEHEGDTNCNWCTWNNPQRIGKGTWRFVNKRSSKDHPEL